MDDDPYSPFELVRPARLDIAELAALIAPRPLLVARPEWGPDDRPDRTTAFAIDRIRFLYDCRLGLDDRFQSTWIARDNDDQIDRQPIWNFLQQNFDQPARDRSAWRQLFDGKTLAGWKVLEFGGEGDVYVDSEAIYMEMGGGMTGISYTGELPTSNYELTYQACRVDGSDFFAALTFPIGDEYCSFINGGWGGTLVGLSSIDQRDASDNETTAFFTFKLKQWYTFRLVVTDENVEVWIDDKRVVNEPRGNSDFSIRAEVDLCKPLGFSSWCTIGAIRDIRLRELPATELPAQPAK